jgi:hypothetical protein
MGELEALARFREAELDRVVVDDLDLGAAQQLAHRSAVESSAVCSS